MEKPPGAVASYTICEIMRGKCNTDNKSLLKEATEYSVISIRSCYRR